MGKAILWCSITKTPPYQALPVTRKHLPVSIHAAVPELTHPVVVVTDFDDGFVLPEIPHSSSSAGAGRGQDVLHLSVPCNTADVLKRLSHKQHSLSHPFQNEVSRSGESLLAFSASSPQHGKAMLTQPFLLHCIPKCQ